MELTVHGVLLDKTYTGDQIPRISITLSAADLEIGQGSIVIPDDAGTDAFQTGWQCKITEGGTTVLVDGFLFDWDRARGNAKAGGARETTFGIEDENAYTANRRRRFVRPAETDYERVIAFANDPFVGLPGAVTSMVLNSSTANLPSKSYWSEDVWAELGTDVVSYTGKTMFVHSTATGAKCLHYHPLTTGHSSGLSISDAAGAANGVTIFVPIAPNFHRDPSELINDLVARDQHGRVVATADATSVAAHDPDGRYHQGLIEVQASSQANLEGQAGRYLTNHKDDRDTYEVTIGPLDWVALSKIRQGDLITVTSSILGLTASTQRIAQMTLFPAPGAGPFLGLWMAKLALAFPRRRGSKGLGGGGGGQGAVPVGKPPAGPVPFIPPTPAGGWDSDTGGTWTGSETHAPDDYLMSAWNGTADGDVVVRGSPDPAQLHLVPGTTYNLTFTITGYSPNSVDPGERLSTVSINWNGYPGNQNTAPADPTPLWQSSLGFTTTFGPSDVIAGYTVTRSYDYIETDQVVQMRFDGDWLCCSGGQVTIRVDVSVAGAELTTAPLHGQPVCPEIAGIGNGVATTFTTRYPYSECSLRVFVGGTNQTTEADETDHESGIFTLSFAPDAGQVIEVWYQGGLV